MESSSNQTVFTRPYFLSKNENPEENYILFRKIEMTIRNNNHASYDLMYFEITNKPSSRQYSNIDIIIIPLNKPEYVFPLLILGNIFFPLIIVPPRYENVSKTQIMQIV